MSLDTLCFSMYSLMSTLMIESSVPKSASASALESSVFPTPVGPRNRNDPIGLFGSLRPTRPLLMALETAVTASSWAITLLCRVFSRFLRRAPSSSASFLTGMRVHLDTTSAMSSAVTLSPAELCFFSAFFLSSSHLLLSRSISTLRECASLRLPLRMLSSSCFSLAFSSFSVSTYLGEIM